jgi:hypothetical protein
MSALVETSLPPSSTPGAAPAPPQPVAFHFSQTEGFAPLLQELGISLLLTTYQANKLLAVRGRGGGLSILVRTFERPMGLAVGAKRIALGTRDQVWQFRDAPDLAAQVDPPGTHDACFLPRASHVTGDIGVHEVCWGGAAGEDLWLVNTRFSCLATLDAEYSFVPRWRPPFVTALAAEDRCHLNGLANARCRLQLRPPLAAAVRDGIGGRGPLPPERARDEGWRPAVRHGARPDQLRRRVARRKSGGRVPAVGTGRRSGSRGPLHAAFTPLPRRESMGAGIRAGAASTC